MEKQKLEDKKKKEGFLCQEVIDLLSKHVLMGSSRSANFEVNLFDNTTYIDKLSTDIMDEFENREKGLRRVSTNLMAFVNEINASDFLSDDKKKDLLHGIQTDIEDPLLHYQNDESINAQMRDMRGEDN